jgi:DNA-binding FrmR family transcriptional regulator
MTHWRHTFLLSDWKTWQMPLDHQAVRVSPEAAKAKLLQRLRTAHGHLEAVILMAETGKPCESVLHQLGAVQAALNCAGRAFIQCQLEQNIENLLSESPETRSNTVLRLSNLYSLLIKT